MAAPTLEDCREWRELLIGEFTSLDWDQESEEDLYFQRFDVTSPGGQFSTKTGSAPADADSAIDSIVPADIMIRVKPARDRKKYKDQADLLTRFGRAMLGSWRKRKDPLRRVASDMVVRRFGVARVLRDDTNWPAIPPELSDEQDPDTETSPKDDWEVKNRRGCPIVMEHRNARYVRWREDINGRILAVVEHYPTTVIEAAIAFSDYSEAERILGGMRDNDKVWIDDVWIGAFRCIFIDDQPIFQGGGVLPHGYARIPYHFAPFRELPFEEPENRYRGMLTNAAELYPAESESLGMMRALIAWNAWRTYVGWTIDDRDLDIVPGRYISIDQRKGEYLQMLEGNPIPQELLQGTAVVDSYIQRNGVAQGPSTAEGTRSAQQVWAIQAMRQQKVDPARQELIRLVSGCLELAAMILETVVAERITLPVPGKDKEGNDYGEVTIGPNDVDGYWDGWTISFGRRLDPALLEQAKALSTLAANNWMPMKVSWELSGLAEVAQDWEDELLIQASERMDFMLELLALARAKTWWGEKSVEYQMILKKVAESQQQRSQGQMPGAPGIPSPGGMQPGGMSGPTAVGPAAAQAMRPGTSARPGGRTPSGPPPRALAGV